MTYPIGRLKPLSAELRVEQCPPTQASTLGFRAWGLGFRVQGLDLGFRGSRVTGCRGHRDSDEGL